MTWSPDYGGLPIISLFLSSLFICIPFSLILVLLITCFFPQIVGSQQDDILSSLTLDHGLS